MANDYLENLLADGRARTDAARLAKRLDDLRSDDRISTEAQDIRAKAIEAILNQDSTAKAPDGGPLADYLSTSSNLYLAARLSTHAGLNTPQREDPPALHAEYRLDQKDETAAHILRRKPDTVALDVAEGEAKRARKVAEDAIRNMWRKDELAEQARRDADTAAARAAEDEAGREFAAERAHLKQVGKGLESPMVRDARDRANAALRDMHKGS